MHLERKHLRKSKGKSTSGVRKGKDIFKQTDSVLLHGIIRGEISQCSWQSFPYLLEITASRKRVRRGQHAEIMGS